MQYSVRISDYQKNTMLNMCDAELMGKDVVDGELKININESYYGTQIIDKDEAGGPNGGLKIYNLTVYANDNYNASCCVSSKDIQIVFIEINVSYMKQ